VLQIPTLPYENTLLLDTDTIVSDDIDELFSLTDKWDIAASTVAESKFEIDEKVPSVLPEFNTGVILFNRNDKTSEFIDKWKSIYKGYLEKNIRMNQPAFREAVHQSSARVITIPTEYNCRANFGGYLTEKVKIIHGSFDNPEQILRDLNESIVPRVFFNKNGCLSVKEVNTTNNRFDWNDQ
jgi:lipopolysaccharide biosynthesis glycosyltransferase